MTDSQETEPDEAGDRSPELGASLGRYRIRGVIGTGGMGTVLAAHDPQLDRAVALKVLLNPGSASLLAEGQALARLRHNHVVTVYDVGEVDGRVFIAMELVRGQTLRKWCDAASRTWREIVRSYIDAARGLAAAHGAGIVHRDFKPDNVLVGDDGVVRVVDFGLAVAAGEGHPFAGTLAYMAPEQREGIVGPEADQYAFAVSLWEAVTGKRPAGSEPAPKGVGPAWLFGMLRKAMAERPSGRYPSIAALVMALERGLARRRNVVIAATAVLALGGTAAVAAMVTGGAGPTCAASRKAVDRVWNVQARLGLAERLGASRRLNARATSDRVVSSLDRRAVQLANAREDTCAARAGDVSDRIAACLDRQIVALEAMVVQLARVDDSTIDHAVTAVGSLPEPTECSTARGAIAPVLRVVVDPLEARFAAAEALGASGHLREAREALEALAPAIRAVAYAPLVADLELARARALGALNDSVTAQSAYQRAAAAAERAENDRALAKAWLGLVDETADAGSPRDALRDLHFAEVAVERANAPDLRETLLWVRSNVELGTGDMAAARRDIEAAVASVRARGAEHTLDGAKLIQQLGRVLYKSDEPERAAEQDRRALAIFIDLLGPEHINVARVLGNLAIDLNERGSTTEARALLERALAIKERTAGPDDLSTASTLQGLEVVAFRAGRFDEAIRHGERIRDIRERKLGPDHPLLASALSDLAEGYVIANRIDDAEAAARRALAIREAANGPDHESVAGPLQALATVLVKRQQPQAALKLLERARETLEHSIGRAKTRTGVVWAGLGETERALGHDDRACAAWTTAVAIIEKDAGPDDQRLIDPLVGVAGCKLRDHDAAAAATAAERAYTISQRAGLPGYRSGRAHVVHARALGPAHRGEAVAELDAALRSYEGAPASLDAERAEVRDWVEKYRH